MTQAWLRESEVLGWRAGERARTFEHGGDVVLKEDDRLGGGADREGAAVPDGRERVHADPEHLEEAEGARADGGLGQAAVEGGEVPAGSMGTATYHGARNVHACGSNRKLGCGNAGAALGLCTHLVSLACASVPRLLRVVVVKGEAVGASSIEHGGKESDDGRVCEQPAYKYRRQ